MMPEESDLREAALAGAEEVLAMQLGETMERVI
jgi:hypothetical protein